MLRIIGWLVAVALFHPCLIQAEPLPAAFVKERPKLVVAIAIDQFRADYLTRFVSRFLPGRVKGGKVGGFGYLMSQGAYFPNGQYELLQDMTCPGHATILTGAYPYNAGIPINNWYDAERGEEVYCVEDPGSPTVGATPKDPHVGTSPKNLLASTTGDELKNAGYPSKVVALSLKDRAAITMGGHRADLALWVDSESLRWVSSRFYLRSGKLPAWVEDLNRQIAKKAPAAKSLGTPYGLEITESAAERAVLEMKLGRGKGSDVLAISFSSHDYAGHEFGPNSPVMEEMTVAEDRLLSKLFNFLALEIPGGLKNVLIVLTADHGVAPNPEWLAENGLGAGRIAQDKLVEQIEEALTKKFGKPEGGKWIAFSDDLNFYFAPKALAREKIDRRAVEEEAKSVIKGGAHGVFHVFSLSDYRARQLPAGMLERQILKTYFPGRSGDIVAIPLPFYITGKAAATHMTGWSYDRTVPILFAGMHIRPGTYAEAANVVDIAPTLAFILGTVAPSMSEGRVLSEILR